MLIPDPAPPPDPRTVVEEADKAPGIDYRKAYPVPIGGPGSPRHEFRTLRLNPENVLLKDAEFENKYSLPNRITRLILGPQSGERNAGIQGVSKAIRNSILRPFNRAENPDPRLVSPPSPDSRPLPPFRERPGSGDRPAAAPQGGGHRSPSPDPEQDSIDAILQSFKDY
jgi:hypothetical protein